MQLDVQQHDLGLSNKQKVVDDQLTTWTSLRQKVPEIETNLVRKQASFFWRMTSTLRKMASFISFREDHGYSSTHAVLVESHSVIEATASESQPSDVQ